MWFLDIRKHQLHFTDREIKSEEQEICKHQQWVPLIHPYASTSGGWEAVSVSSYRTHGITESPPSSVLDAVELRVLSWVNSAAPRVAGGMRGGMGIVPILTCGLRTQFLQSSLLTDAHSECLEAFYSGHLSTDAYSFKG